MSNLIFSTMENQKNHKPHKNQLSVKQVAEMLECSKMNIYKHYKKGNLKGYSRDGKHVLFDLADVMDFKENFQFFRKLGKEGTNV